MFANYWVLTVLNKHFLLFMQRDRHMEHEAFDLYPYEAVVHQLYVCFLILPTSSGRFCAVIFQQDGASFSFCLEHLLPPHRSLDPLCSSYCKITSSRGSRNWEEICACVAELGEHIVAPVVGSSHEGLQMFTVVKGNFTILLFGHNKVHILN